MGASDKCMCYTQYPARALHLRISKFRNDVKQMFLTVNQLIIVIL